MAGLTLTMETAKSTLLNTQVQMQVTSHNIANAENKSYARQKAVLSTNPPNLTHGGWIGTGASVETIVQARDQFIEQRLRSSISAQSQYGTLTNQLSAAQTSLSDNGSSGISQALGAFWDSWDVLIQNPQGPAEQAGVYSAADRLAQSIRNTFADLESLESTDPLQGLGDIPEEIQGVVQKANDLLARIANFNYQIAQNESPGHFANDLRDGRYQALQDLAEIIPIQFDETSQTVSISLGGSSVELVSGAQVNANPLQYGVAAGEIQITFTAYGGVSAPPATAVSGGSLGGLLTAHNDIQEYMTKLDNFATTLASEVNTAFDLSPSVFTATGADDIDITRDATGQPVFLSTPTPAELSGAALAVSNLQDTRVDFAGTVAGFIEYLGDIQHEVGLDLQNAQDEADFYGSLRTQIEVQQQSVSGVSLDEEMVELLKHQQVYQAAAKILQQTAEMMQSIMDIV